MGYRPGVGIHPSADPARALDAPSDPASALLSGWRLYSQGDWWEAHEVWECGWRMIEDRRVDRRALVLQGLIQLAAARLRGGAGDERSAAQLRQAGREKLVAGDPAWALALWFGRPDEPLTPR